MTVASIQKSGWGQSGLLLIISLFVSLVMAEIVLRLIAPKEFLVWPPGFEQEFRPTPGIMPGVQGVSRFSINDIGIRGRSWSQNDGYRILAVGGSTTECLYLDDSETWPHLVQRRLNEDSGDSSVWVGNVCISGRTTRHHILQVEKLLGQRPSVDMVLLLAGVNDMLMPLRQLPG